MAKQSSKSKDVEHREYFRLEALKHFNEFLKEKGLSKTEGRENIVNCIYEMEGHFDMETLESELAKSGVVHRATIYRTIRLLIEAGLLAKVKTDTHSRVAYEHTLGHCHHDHLICDECGDIVEFTDPTIEELQEKIAEKFGFELKHHNLILTGICGDCQRIKRKNTRSPSKVIKRARIRNHSKP